MYEELAAGVPGVLFTPPWPPKNELPMEVATMNMRVVVNGELTPIIPEFYRVSEALDRHLGG